MDTDRTRVKSGHSDLPVPVPAPNITEAQQRSPTLMAGTDIGEQVQIWAPSKLRLLFGCRLSGVAAALCLCLSVVDILHGDYLFLFYNLFYALILSGFSAGFRTLLRRPRYAATDASGIAVTTSSDSIAVSWADINGIRWWGDSLALLPRGETSPQEQVVLNLRGYPWRTREELVQLIIKQAALEPDPFYPGQFLSLDEMARRGLESEYTEVEVLADPAEGQGHTEPRVE